MAPGSNCMENLGCGGCDGRETGVRLTVQTLGGGSADFVGSFVCSCEEHCELPSSEKTAR